MTGPAPRHVEEGRDADAHPLPLRPERRLLGAERIIIGERPDLLHQHRRVAGIVSDPERRLVRELLGRDQVAGAELHRVDAHLLGPVLDQALHLIDGLGPAGPAIGVHRRRVGVDGADGGVDRRNVVGERQHAEVIGVGDARLPLALVGAEGCQRLELHAEDLAVRIEAHAAHRVVVAGVRVAQQALGARARPAHRPAGDDGAPQHQRLLGVVVELHAEAAAHVRRDHAQLVLGNVERLGEVAAHDVRRLVGGPHRVAVVHLVVVPQVAAGLHRGGGDAVGGHRDLGDVVGVGERRFRLLPEPVLGDQHLVGAEGGMHERGLGIERPRGERVGRLLLVGDGDRLGGVERLVTVLGDDHGDDLADAADHAVDADERAVGGAGVRPAPVLDRPDPLGLAVAGPGPVLAGEHGQHPRHRCGLRRIDARHCGVGVGAADEGGVGDGLVEPHILDEPPPPPGEKRSSSRRKIA